MDKDKIRNAAQLIIKHGGVDLDAKTHYTTVHSFCRHVGLPHSLDYDHLEQAARNVMDERESGGRMIWEINIDKFADEYMRLAESAG